MLALVLAARPDGVRAAELGHPDINKATAILRRLLKAGLLFRSALGVRTVRFFTTPKAAQRWYEAHYAAHQAKQYKSKPRAKFDHDAPMIFTDKTIYTYAPPPPAMVFRTNTHQPL
jgi:hypothetical protein